MLCRLEAQLSGERETNQRLKGEGGILRRQHTDMKLQLDSAKLDVTNLTSRAATLQEVGKGSLHAVHSSA